MIVDLEIEVFFLTREMSKEQQSQRLIDPDFSFPYKKCDKRVITVSTISHFEPHYDYDDIEYFEENKKHKEYTLITTYSGVDLVVDMTYADFKQFLANNMLNNLDFNNQ